MARYTTLNTTTASVSSSSSLNVSYSIGSDYINIYKVKIVPSTGAGGTNEFQIYKETARTTLLYTSGEFTGTWYDPVNNDGTTITEGEEGYICPYEDDSAGTQLHCKFINNDSVSKTYTITVIYDTYASSGTSTFDTSVIIDVTASEAINIRKNGDSGDIFVVDTSAEQVDIGGQLQVSDTGPHVFGGTTLDYIQNYITGSFTSGGASTYNAKVLIDGTLTGAIGDTTSTSTVYVKPVITTQSNTETITLAAGLRIDTPVITVGTDTVTSTATLYIQGASTAGSSDYALWVDSGTTRIDSTLYGYGAVYFFGANVNCYSGCDLIMQSYDNNTGIGPNIILENNTDATTPAGGVITLWTKSGTAYYLHVSDDGKLRLGTTAPNNANDTTNTVVGTQSQ